MLSFADDQLRFEAEGARRNRFRIRPVDRQQAEPEGLGDHVGLVAGPQLVAHVFDVPFDRPRGDGDFVRNFLGGHAVGDKLENLPLARAELGRAQMIVESDHIVPEKDVQAG